MRPARRNFLFGTGASLALAGCLGNSGPGTLTLSAQGAAGMNPGPDGSDRPLTLTIVQLKGAGAFDGADYFALQDPAAALGADLLKSEQIVVQPAKDISHTVALEDGATVIGLIAGYRNPAGKTFRAKTAAGKGDAFVVSVRSGGISLMPV